MSAAVRHRAARVLFAAAWVSCAAPAARPAAPEAASAKPVAASDPTAWQLDRSTFDPAAAPCDDFYQYVCGGFDAPAQIPADRAQAEWERDAATAANDRAIQSLLTGTDHAGESDIDRLRAFFASCMATGDAADRLGDATLTTWLGRIEAIRRPGDVLAVVRELHGHGINVWFAYTGEPDTTDRTRYRGQIQEGISGASSRLYADAKPGADERRDAYRRHIQRMLELSGVAPARARDEARTVFELEATLAAAVPPGLSYDLIASEHPTTPAALRALAPHLDWSAYLAMVGHPAERSLNVTAPALLQAVDGLVATRPLGDLRAYLRWQLLQSLARALPARFADERDQFSATLGVQLPPRAERCQLETVKALGVELSRQFSRRFIGAEAREQAHAVAQRVRSEMVASAKTIGWLSPAARAFSSDKLAMLALKIGYPETWPDTGSFVLRRDAYLDNVLAARAYEQQRSWKRAQAERRRDSWENEVRPNAAWGMAAARLTIPNGFPDAFSNSIVITAARLRAPLFDAAAPPEVGYGGFGAIMGHELVHVLETHMVTAQGELRESWGAEDIKALDGRHACMIDQGNQFVAIDATHLDGGATIDENLADLGGVAHAYAAMAHDLGARVATRGADGLTPAMRFFVAYAQNYCTAQRPAYVRESLRSDGHAPPRFRVNAPLSNLPAFAEAFSCRGDAAMVRPAKSRCVVW